MTEETMWNLNNRVLVGMTEKRKNSGAGWLKQDGSGHAWHFREDLQGEEPNHYPGAIPISDVLRRLFSWHAVSVPMKYTGVDGEDRIAPDRQLIIANDDNSVLGVFKNGYQPHQLDEWLIENVAQLAGHGLGCASAALLKNRAQAFVQFELGEQIQTDEGFAFSPYLGAYTSFDGSLLTNYDKGATAYLCDNSFNYGRKGASAIWKTRHSKYSQLRIKDAREALGIIEQVADEFSATIAQLAATDVTLKEWEALLDELVPVPGEASGTKSEKRLLTVAENKREVLNELYKRDERAATWNGTALGVLQAFNTWGQHFKNVKNAPRIERNLSDLVFGKIADDDDNTLQTLDKIRSQRTLVHA